MKLSRGSAVAALLCVSLPLSVACGSVASDGLFSPTGGSTQAAGANGDRAGAPGAGSGQGGSAANAGAPNTVAGSNGEGGDGNGGTGAVSGSGAGGEAEGGSSHGGTAGEPSTSGGSSGEAMGGSAGSGIGGSTAGTGGTNTGGTANGGSAGSGPGPVCPPAPPQDGATCTVSTPNSCFYPGNACSCLPTGGAGAARKWACLGDGAKCPEAKPTAGLACSQYGDVSCPYPNAEYCACTGNGTPRWGCSTNPTCPATRPGATYCGQTVRVCGYPEGVQCFCSAGSAWQCLAP